MIVFAALVGSASAGCDTITLQGAIERAENGFVEMDETGFDSAARDARTTLDCLANPLTPVLVAGFHRVNALEAFLRGDHAAATMHFQSVRGSQPGYVLPETIAPQGHPLRVDFDKSGQFAETGKFSVDPPADGWLLLDGQRSTEAPSGRPFVFQWIHGDGTVGETQWVSVGGALPSYPIAETGPIGGGGGGKPKTLLFAGIGTAIVGGALYGTAFVTKGAYTNAVYDGDKARIDSTHSTTNILAGTGTALLSGGALLAVVGAF